MPSRPRTLHALDPIDSTETPPTEAAPAPRGTRTTTPRDRAGPDSVWVRVGVPERDPDEPSGDDAGEPSEAQDPSSVSVADVESALDGLGVEVDALGTDDAGGDDLQRVVDHYERLIAERDRAIRDREGAGVGPDRGSGLLAAVRTRVRAAADRLRR